MKYGEPQAPESLGALWRMQVKNLLAWEPELKGAREAFDFSSGRSRRIYDAFAWRLCTEAAELEGAAREAWVASARLKAPDRGPFYDRLQGECVDALNFYIEVCWLSGLPELFGLDGLGGDPVPLKYLGETAMAIGPRAATARTHMGEYSHPFGDPEPNNIGDPEAFIEALKAAGRHLCACINTVFGREPGPALRRAWHEKDKINERRRRAAAYEGIE